MLQDIRDNSQGVIAKIIIGLIVAVFALFGVESIIGGFTTAPPVAEINGEEITEAQLQFGTQNLINSIGGNIQGLDQELLEQIALNQLIEETVLRQAAERASLSVSENAIDRIIIRSPQFQVNGTFNPDLAMRTMASQGYSVPLYRDQLKQQMLLSQVANAYSSSNFILDSELQSMAELTEQTRDFRYIPITLGTRTLGTPITDAEIEAYYNENQDEFADPETVVVSYVVLDQNAIAEEIVVDEADLLAQYEQERNDFEGSAERRAAHILFEVGPNMSEDEAMTAATAAVERLAAGEDFAALALELSSDRISAEDGGDIGYSDGSAFPPEIESALEAMSVDEVSEPVVTEFGVHLVKLTEDAVNVFQPFEEVRDRIEREMESAEVELRYSERLSDLSNLAFETGDLQTIADDLGLDIQQSPAFGRNGGSGIFANPDLVAAAYSDSVFLDGNNSDVIEISPTQAVVVRLQEFNPASIRPLEEVQPEIAVLLRTQMEREAVQDLGNAIMTAIENGDDVENILAENGLEWIEQTGIGRNSPMVNAELLSRVFAMPAPESGGEPRQDSLSLANGTFAVIELTAVTPGSMDAMEEAQRMSISQQMQSDLGSSDFDAYLANLRESADIRAAVLEEDF